MLRLLGLAFLLGRVGVGAFEVPFPQSAVEIRASVVSSAATGPSTVTQQLLLGSGTRAEVISCLPESKSGSSDFFSALFGTATNNSKKPKYDKPVLAFLHGSFHASWCWSENYMPYFASLGYPCVAFSLQGTGGTPTVEAGAKKVQISRHVADLDAFLRGLSDDDANSLGLELGQNPQIVLLGHSFGGLTIMKWCEQYYSSNEQNVNLLGLSLLCSVPPSGNGKMTMRFLQRSFRDSWKITAGFVLKKAITDKEICRELFFGDNGVSDEDIERYQSYFERDTVATIDLGDLAKKLPSKDADRSGKAPFTAQLPSQSLVIRAIDDFIVDEEGSVESARYLDGRLVTIDSPHDVMLGNKWQNGADAILEWVQGLL